ncbi:MULTISPECIES: hypothetical protein [Pseudomonas]|uniref:hypothetical protein n=1 Tax=Pseudomonas TaxID=286 RepID=UPI001179B8F0|nr:MULTISPECIES: hypothetical protein [Pseudomonas]
MYKQVCHSVSNKEAVQENSGKVGSQHDLSNDTQDDIDSSIDIGRLWGTKEGAGNTISKGLALSSSDVKFIDLEAGAKLYKMSPYETFDVTLAEAGDQARLADVNNVDKDWVGQYFADDPETSRGYAFDYLDDNGNGKVYLYEAIANSPVRMIVNNKPSHGSTDFTGQSKADAVRSYLASSRSDLDLGGLPLMNALSERAFIYKGPHSIDSTGSIEDYEVIIGASSLSQRFTIRKIETLEYRRFELKS